MDIPRARCRRYIGGSAVLVVTTSELRQMALTEYYDEAWWFNLDPDATRRPPSISRDAPHTPRADDQIRFRPTRNPWNANWRGDPAQDASTCLRRVAPRDEGGFKVTSPMPTSRTIQPFVNMKAFGLDLTTIFACLKTYSVPIQTFKTLTHILFIIKIPLHRSARTCHA